MEITLSKTTIQDLGAFLKNEETQKSQLKVFDFPSEVMDTLADPIPQHEFAEFYHKMTRGINWAAVHSGSNHVATWEV